MLPTFCKSTAFFASSTARLASRNFGSGHVANSQARSLFTPGFLRVEFDGLREAGDGLVELFLAAQAGTNVRQVSGALGRELFPVEFDDHLVAGDGLIQL